MGILKLLERRRKAFADEEAIETWRTLFSSGGWILRRKAFADEEAIET